MNTTVAAAMGGPGTLANRPGAFVSPPALGLHRLRLVNNDFMNDGVDVRILSGRTLRYWMVQHLHGQRTSCSVAALLAALGGAGYIVAGRPSKRVSDALSVEVQRGRVIRTGWGRYAAGTPIPRSTHHRMLVTLAARQKALWTAYDTAGRGAFTRFLSGHCLSESGGIFMLPGLRPGPDATQPVLVRASVLERREVGG